MCAEAFLKTIRIVVLDGHTLNPGDNPWDAVAALGDLTVYDRTPPELILERAARADIVLTNKTVLDAGILAELPQLHFVSVLATGHNVVDVAAAGRQGIPVSNVPEYSSLTVAQHTFALILELANRVGLHDAAVQAGEWGACPDFSFWKEPLTELVGLKLGIVGFGRIGQAVARIGRAFGLELLVHTPHPPLGLVDPAVRFVPLDELFITADVVSLHCPLTAANAGFVDRSLLTVMKRTAFFVNTARGGLVNEYDLAAALNCRQIAGAAVDVVSREPIAPDNPLLGARNCLITPHLGWATLAARRRLMAQTAANVAAFLEGAPVNVVNAPFLPPVAGA
jgi:glycerate dehydrogenase